VRVEGPDPGLSAEELQAAAAAHLAAREHRRLDIDDEAAGRRLRPAFSGWRTARLLWLRWDAPAPEGVPAMEEVAAEEVADLRWEWVMEDPFDPSEERARAFMRTEAQAYELRGSRWLVRRDEGGAPMAFVVLLEHDGAAEISLAFCTRERRGEGIGTSLLLSAVAAARDCDDVWIVADDEARPKGLYQRLGFAPAWIAHEFTRFPR
jgi:GNAT superfamily N-acetyltransferase